MRKPIGVWQYGLWMQTHAQRLCRGPAKRTSRTAQRVGPSTIRGQILNAAREMFAELGYERTTLRGVAARTGVDQALI